MITAVVQVRLHVSLHKVDQLWSIYAFYLRVHSADMTDNDEGAKTKTDVYAVYGCQHKPLGL